VLGQGALVPTDLADTGTADTGTEDAAHDLVGFGHIFCKP
jgi:hypothetical protein